MKKQILLLMVAFMASLTVVWGQMQPSSKQPRPLTCPSEPLHPRAGVEYTYQVSTGGDTPATSYRWWATKDPAFIQTVNGTTNTNVETRLTVTNPGQLLQTSTNYGVVSSENNVKITWSAEILAGTRYQANPGDTPSPTFVVVMAEGDCSNNIEVYELNPLPSFTLDIANINPTDFSPMNYDVDAEQCVDIVRGATYNTTNKSLDMNYGTDTLYFEVIASNFATNWIPTFQVMQGITAPQTAVIGWSYTLTDARNGIFIDGEQAITVGNPLTGSTALTADATANINDGVSIYVRVIITNNTYESLDDQTFELAVDGKDATDQWDIHHEATACESPDAADQLDRASHIVRARPTINHDTVDSGAPNPTDFIDKP